MMNDDQFVSAILAAHETLQRAVSLENYATIPPLTREQIVRDIAQRLIANKLIIIRTKHSNDNICEWTIESRA